MPYGNSRDSRAGSWARSGCLTSLVVLVVIVGAVAFLVGIL